MSSVRIRENTFKLCLKNFPKRPTYEEIHAFVHDKVGLKPTQVTRLQMNHSQNCVHIKCVDLKTAQDAVINHNDRHELVVDKKRIKVRLMMDDAGVEIKIHDLSENIRNEEVAAYLKQYGDVLSVRDVVWSESFKYKGVNTGVRVAKVVLRRHIKSFVTILGETTMISYRTQPQTCRHCHNQLHPGSSCVENKKLLGQKQDLNKRLDLARNQHSAGSSYADVLGRMEEAATPLMPQFTPTNLTQLHEQLRGVAAEGVEASSSLSATVPCPPPRAEGDVSSAVVPMEQSAIEQAAIEQAVVEQAAIEQAAFEKAAIQQAANEQAANEQAAIEQAAIEQAAIEQAANEQAAIEQSELEQSAMELDAQSDEAKNDGISSVPNDQSTQQAEGGMSVEADACSSSTAGLAAAGSTACSQSILRCELTSSSAVDPSENVELATARRINSLLQPGKTACRIGSGRFDDLRCSAFCMIRIGRQCCRELGQATVAVLVVEKLCAA
ncbi:hypothetical protein quinque_002339 [Culex quinquefasciatus]